MILYRVIISVISKFYIYLAYNIYFIYNEKNYWYW